LPASHPSALRRSTVVTGYSGSLTFVGKFCPHEFASCLWLTHADWRVDTFPAVSQIQKDK